MNGFLFNNNLFSTKACSWLCLKNYILEKILCVKIKVDFLICWNSFLCRKSLRSRKLLLQLLIPTVIATHIWTSYIETKVDLKIEEDLDLLGCNNCIFLETISYCKKVWETHLYNLLLQLLTPVLATHWETSNWNYEYLRLKSRLWTYLDCEI